jgi:hypothetical protein
LTWAGVTAIITGAATIVSGFIYAWKRLFPPTSPAATDAGIQATAEQDASAAENTGRPQ